MHSRGILYQEEGHFLSEKGHFLSEKGHFLSGKGDFLTNEGHFLSQPSPPVWESFLNFLDRNMILFNIKGHFFLMLLICSSFILLK